MPVSESQKKAMDTAQMILKKYWDLVLPVPVIKFIKKEKITIRLVKSADNEGTWFPESETIAVKPNLLPNDERKILARCLGLACLVNDSATFVPALILPVEPFVNAVCTEKLSMSSVSKIFGCDIETCEAWYTFLKNHKIISETN